MEEAEEEEEEEEMILGRCSLPFIVEGQRDKDGLGEEDEEAQEQEDPALGEGIISGSLRAENGSSSYLRRGNIDAKKRQRQKKRNKGKKRRREIRTDKGEVRARNGK